MPLLAWRATGAVEAAPRAAAVEPLAARVADRVAEAVDQVVAMPALRTLAAGSWQLLLHEGDLVRKLDAVQRQLLVKAEQRHAMIATGIGLTGGLSIGYVVWLVRGGVLVSSMLSALPAWQMMDPLPVLAARRGRAGTAKGPDGKVEELFDETAAKSGQDRRPAP